MPSQEIAHCRHSRINDGIRGIRWSDKKMGEMYLSNRTREYHGWRTEPAVVRSQPFFNVVLNFPGLPSPRDHRAFSPFYSISFRCYCRIGSPFIRECYSCWVMPHTASYFDLSRCSRATRRLRVAEPRSAFILRNGFSDKVSLRRSPFGSV